MEWLESFNKRFSKSLNLDHSSLHQAIRYSLEQPGKRIRPRFVEESGKLIQLHPQLIQHTSFAIEMAHVFSLVHDDLPCLDNDDFRRGQLTTHKKFGEAQGLLAGDALLNLAHETFLKNIHFVEPEKFFLASSYFMTCIGHEGMILGQSLELDLDPQNVSLEQLLKVQDLKTGALFRAALICPLLLGGLQETDELFQETLHYARAFGFAFQIADDLADEAQDLQQGQKSILHFMGRSEAIDQARKRLLESKIAHHFSATALLLDLLQPRP